jgi:dihydrofolate reductase
LLYQLHTPSALFGQNTYDSLPVPVLPITTELMLTQRSSPRLNRAAQSQHLMTVKVTPLQAQATSNNTSNRIILAINPIIQRVGRQHLPLLLLLLLLAVPAAR